MTFRNKSARYFILSFTLLTLSSCSVWENFTTYFNLYYNTASLFEDAENEILNQKRDLFSNDPLVVQGNAKNALVKVIEKSSKLLQFNANSGYVDESLIMLGKAFFYQNNFQKSKRKFEELLATNPEDDAQITEANLWIAKCMFALKENSPALKLIQDVRVKSVEAGYDMLIRSSYIEEIKYHLREENYTLAISLANEFADEYDESETRAEIYYELGKLYSLTGDNENAISAYEKVLEYSSDFDLEIAATIKYANSLRDAGQLERALEVFEDIRSQDKFQTSFNEIDLEIGKTRARLGQYADAYEKFRMVDSTYKNSPFAAAANFELAELYRYNFFKYDSAQYYYARSVSGNPPKEYIEEARNSSQLFQKYSKLRKDINKFSRQLFYTENPDIFTKDSAAYVEDSLIILNDFLAKKELQEIWKTDADTQPDLKSERLIDSAVVKHNIIISDSLRKVDSLIQLGLYNPPDSAGLRQRINTYLIETFVKDSLSKVDSLIRIGKYNFRDTTGLRIKIKNAITEKSKNIFGQKDGNKSKLAQLLQNPGQVRLDTVKFRKNPPLKLTLKIDSAKAILAKNSLELGNLFLTELDVPDSAYALYKSILDYYPVGSYYPNTLYALGSYYQTVDNDEKADSLFRIIYDNYKDRSIVNAAADKLKMPLIDLEYDPAKDQYALAEGLMLEGAFDQSASGFYNIYRNHPGSNFAPKALYTSGFILEHDLLLLDSAAVIYDTLVAKYPTSVYVKNVSKKLNAYKQEKARIQKAYQDSLLALQRQKADSLDSGDKTVKDDSQKIVEDAFAVNEETKGKQTENTNVLPGANGLIQKKLEPLWDPRKHFQ